MIRAAAIDDVPVICDMAEEFWATTRYDDPFDWESVADMAAHCIQSGIMLLLLDDAGVPQGFACAVIGGLLGNRNVQVATEVAYYVYPDSRKGYGGIALIKALEQSAKDKGCKYLNMALMHDAEPEAAQRIYEKHGFTLNESLYTRAL